MTESKQGLLNIKSKRTWFSRVAYSGEADDTRIVKLDRSRLPLRGERPTSQDETVGLIRTGKKDDRWGDEIITKDNY